MSDPTPGKPRPPVKVPKLARDKMPAIWRKWGDKVAYRYLHGAELKRALLDKVLEEAKEVHEEPTLEEFADLLEVLFAAAKAHGHAPNVVQKARQQKNHERGGFDLGLYLTSFEWGPHQ